MIRDSNRSWLKSVAAGLGIELRSWHVLGYVRRPAAYVRRPEREIYSYTLLCTLKVTRPQVCNFHLLPRQQMPGGPRAPGSGMWGHDVGASTQQEPAGMVTRAGARATTSSREDSQEEQRAATPAKDLPKAAAPAASSPVPNPTRLTHAIDQRSIKTSTQEDLEMD